MPSPSRIFRESVGEPLSKGVKAGCAAKPRTYADELFANFPNARKTMRGVPDMCPHELFGRAASPACSGDCASCWNRPLPDALTAQKGDNER